MKFQTVIRSYNDDAIAEGAAQIRAGLPVAVPTETVYGLAADAENGDAVARIFEVKQRPDFNPLIVHVRNLEQAVRFATFNEAAIRLAERYWPGPLTLVLPLRPGGQISSLVTAGLDSIALRIPAHRAMQALLAATGCPLAAPSANASGTISPTTAQHVFRTLAGRIPMIIDDGPTPIGIESTVVRCDGQGIYVLRPGPIIIDGAERPSTCNIESPGQMQKHYAPTKPLRLDATVAHADEWLIGFGAVDGDRNLSPSGDLVEVMANLFDALHQADESGRARIAVAPISGDGIAESIRDRLARAAC